MIEDVARGARQEAGGSTQQRAEPALHDTPEEALLERAVEHVEAGLEDSVGAVRDTQGSPPPAERQLKRGGEPEHEWQPDQAEAELNAEVAHRQPEPGRPPDQLDRRDRDREGQQPLEDVRSDPGCAVRGVGRNELDRGDDASYSGGGTVGLGSRLGEGAGARLRRSAPVEERYFERRRIADALSWAEAGGVAIHRNFDHYHGTRSGRGFVMTRPFLHVIGMRTVLEGWALQNGVPVEAIQPEKRRRVAHIDVFGDFALQLLSRVEPLTAAAESFRLFTGVGSQLYSRLSAAILDDPELLALSAQAATGQPPPNLLFGAVHHLLLQGVGHPLARLYPSLNGGNDVGEDPYPAFRNFCLTYRDALADAIRGRAVQTNEVARSSALQRGMAVVAQRMGRPLAILEVGASAGLNLIGDRYRYSYGPDTEAIGDPDSPVLIECRTRGALRPPGGMPAIAWRLGIDRNPIDVRDPDQALWLRALVWPDQPWRAELLLAAIRLAQDNPPPLRRGDALELLEGAAAEAPRDAELCIYSSFTVYQFLPAQRARLESVVAAVARARPVHRLALEWFPGERPYLDLESRQDGTLTRTRLAAAHEHGAWLEWLDPASARQR